MRSFDTITMMFVFQQLATELPSILTLMGSSWRRSLASRTFVLTGVLGLACGVSLVPHPVSGCLAGSEACRRRRPSIGEEDQHCVRPLLVAGQSISTILLVVAVYVGRDRLRVSLPSQTQP